MAKNEKNRSLWTYKHINKVIPDKRKKKPRHKVNYKLSKNE